jgi:pyruvate kinase
MTDLWITLGPSSIDRVQDLLCSGVNGVRLMFSFGTPELQEERALNVKAAAERVGSKCLTIADLPGEKIRLGSFEGDETIDVSRGQRFEVVAEDSENPSSTGRLPLPHADFLSKLRVGDAVIIGDGSAVLQVEDTQTAHVMVRSLSAGVINQTRGITLQGGSFIPSCLTQFDEESLRFIAESHAFDMVALSFVSSADSILRARSILGDYGRTLPVVAKIETSTAISQLDEICVTADMVMAARGDLALYMPWPELPKAVELIADSAGRAGTPWILASQIAEGLERFAMPTRAEICDLAHWLTRGCEAVMLSYETVFGTNASGAVSAVSTILDRWRGAPDLYH